MHSTLTVNRHERFGLVGESGCGKSTAVMSVLRLVPPPGRIVGGQILLSSRDDGGWADDLVSLSENEMRRVRWERISLIPQGAMNSLNPVTRVYAQIADGIVTHEGPASKRELEERIGELLVTVGLLPQVMRMFPHELSGGMKQRVCVAMAIALNPQLIIADEPTSALDVVVQRLVMTTLGRLQKETGASVILVGHEMGLIAQFADKVGVMYAGKLVELSPIHQIVNEPLHPYSDLLLQSVPGLDEKRERLVGIPGMPPRLIDLPPGCLFAPRCPSAMARCSQVSPDLEPFDDGRQVACHLYSEATAPEPELEVDA